ncbi:hypothetical protein [Azospirillum sp.]|uniref:hypothetical protein n=1 Tax=Azospirillum sp. TaxID=34012 RepID=UPI003D7070CD
MLQIPIFDTPAALACTLMFALPGKGTPKATLAPFLRRCIHDPTQSIAKRDHLIATTSLARSHPSV